jgi:thioredoxin reductase
LIVNDRLDAVQLTGGGSMPRSALFIRPTLQARGDSLIRSLGVEVDESGLARVDATGRTTVSGVWAAGNASNPRAQVITAAGEGSAAAIDINNDLVQDDVREARQSNTSGRTVTASTKQLERTSS